MKNKISTLGYFMKRLKDNNFVVWKIFNKYAQHDPRVWTVMINPGEESMFITCYVNANERGADPVFELHDGMSLFRNYAKIQTKSMEVIIKYILQRGVQPDSKTFRVNDNEQSNTETHVTATG